jgi:hypothetical protein
MLRVAITPASTIAQLRARAQQIAARRIAAILRQRRPRRRDWRSASALWPDFVPGTAFDRSRN